MTGCERARIPSDATGILGTSSARAALSSLICRQGSSLATSGSRKTRKQKYVLIHTFLAPRMAVKAEYVVIHRFSTTPGPTSLAPSCFHWVLPMIQIRGQRLAPIHGRTPLDHRLWQHPRSWPPQWSAARSPSPRALPGKMPRPLPPAWIWQTCSDDTANSEVREVALHPLMSQA